MKNTPTYLFVYGTLKNSKSEMHALLARNSTFVSEAWFPGELFKIDYYPGAIYLSDSKSKVFGEVYELIKSDYILKLLDVYEECYPYQKTITLDNIPDEYVRVQKEITLTNNEKLISWIYLYNRDILFLEKINTGIFLNN